MSTPQDVLKHFQPKKEFFNGIDSEECVIDTMDINHKVSFSMEHFAGDYKQALIREFEAFLPEVPHWKK